MIHHESTSTRKAALDICFVEVQIALEAANKFLETVNEGENAYE